MDRIAIISDIHGNLPALEAVLEDIRQRGINRIFCLGDIIGKGPSSDQAVDLIRNHCEAVIKGNWDDFVSRESESEMVHWHQALLGMERMDYLRSLPFAIEFRMSGRQVRLFHASPRSLYERIQPWDELEKRESLFASSELCSLEGTADVAGYGDIHNAYLQHLGGRMLFNTGSVGNPLDIPQASYVVLEGIYEGTNAAPLHIQFARVPYDIELAIQQAMEAGMPDLEPYIQELRSGKYRGSKK